MKLLEKLGAVEGAFGLFGRIFGWVPIVFGTTVVAVASAWATRATELFKEYLPAAAVLGALVGALVFISIVYVWTRWRVTAAQLQFARSMMERPPPLNPLETTFVKQRIPMSMFMTPLREPVENRTFTDCELLGPAVVAFLGNSTIANANIINCDFVRVVKGRPILNAIPMFHTIINRGKLKNLTILVPEDAVKGLPPDIPWITH